MDNFYLFIVWVASRVSVFQSVEDAAAAEALLRDCALEMMTLNVVPSQLATLLKEVEPASKLVLAVELVLLVTALVLAMFSAASEAVEDALWAE